MNRPCRLFLATSFQEEVAEIRWRVVRFFLAIVLVLMAGVAEAQTLSPSNAQIDWKVANRFRFFRNGDDFRAHETAWRTYLLHVRQQNLSEEKSDRLIATTSVIGSEHVLNDRYIPFTRILRKNYEPQGWASRQVADTCWNASDRAHDACGSVDDYLSPKSHEIEKGVTMKVMNKREREAVPVDFQI